MSTFNAEVKNNNTISITSDTNWVCQSIGNFRLSKYNGEGNDSIKIIVPEDLPNGNGYVYFSYDDEKCDYPYVQVYSVNECFIETMPKYRICDGKKTAFLYFKQEGELVDITINTNYPWNVKSPQNLTYFANNNKLTIVAKENVGIISIKINAETTNCDFFLIKLMKKQ